MYFNLKKKVGSLLVAIAMITSMFSGLPVMAAGNIEVVLTPVTDGDAKIQVSVKGNVENVTAMQVAFDVTGELEYKGVDYLVDVDAPADAKIGNKLSVGFALDNAISFADETPVFIIAFSGDAGDSVTVTVDNEHSYCYTDSGTSVYATGESSKTVQAEENAKESHTATIKVKMDKVPGFIAGEEPAVSLKIKDSASGNVIAKTTLNTENRDSGSKAEFTITSKVVKDNKYTIEISGIGYKTYTATDVVFDDILTITNSEFIPGDVNKDGEITDADKTAYENLIAKDEYNPAADFNRDGYVDERDNVFGVSDSDNDENDDNENESTEDDSDSGNSGGGNNSGGGGGGGGGAWAPAAPFGTFIDLENYAWAKDSIYALKNKGIISGVSETEYAPAKNIKRGDFILILTRMLSINDIFTKNFADVPVSSYYYNAIGSARVAGIAQGSGENFMPENTITRQDLITLAYRAFLAKGYITATDDMSSLNAFADKGSISNYAMAPMAAMVKAGIIQGSNGNVNPLGNATRAEVAVMCARLEALIY